MINKISCISVALAKGGYPIKGVIYNPYRQETFYAEKGFQRPHGLWYVHTCITDLYRFD